MLLREFTETDNAGTMEEGVLKDVLILGSKSRNKREYLATALQKAVPLYEGQAVFADHPTAVDRDRKGRSAADRFGVLRNVHFVDSAAGPQLRGDLHHLVTHPLSPRVEEDQRRNLRFFGLSHLADGTAKFNPERNVAMVESIDKVTEVDLVTNPATALSLREQAEAEMPADEPTKEEEKSADKNADAELVASIEAVLKEAAVVVSDPASSLGDKKAALETAEAKIQELFAAHLGSTEEEPAVEAEPVKAEEQTATLLASIGTLTEQVKTLEAGFAELKKKSRKYVGVGTPAPETIALAEQAQTDAYPDNGTPAEKAAWLRRRRQ